MQACAPGAIGGLERVVQCLSIGLAEAGHHVHVIASHVPGTTINDFVAPLRAGGATVHPVEVGGRAYFKERRIVADLLDQLGPDVVHFHGYRADLLHRSAARRVGAATISTLHGSSRVGGLAGLYERIHERSLRHLDAVISVSRPLTDEIRKWVPSQRLHTIPNASPPVRDLLSREEARARLQLPIHGTVIGWVGRLVPVKGPDLFLDAISRIQERPWTACVVGDGPELASLRALADSHGIGTRVHFAGAVPNASKLLQAFDAVAISSRSEGTPMILLEAMAAQVPVVCTGVGGIPDVLSDERLGWMTPPGDLAALASSLEQVIRERDESASRAARASAHVHQEYGVAPWIRRHESLYRGVTRRAP